MRRRNPVSLHEGGKEAKSRESVKKLVRNRSGGLKLVLSGWHAKAFGVIGAGGVGALR